LIWGSSDLTAKVPGPARYPPGTAIHWHTVGSPYSEAPP